MYRGLVVELNDLISLEHGVTHLFDFIFFLVNRIALSTKRGLNRGLQPKSITKLVPKSQIEETRGKYRK